MKGRGWGGSWDVLPKDTKDLPIAIRWMRNYVRDSQIKVRVRDPTLERPPGGGASCTACIPVGPAFWKSQNPVLCLLHWTDLYLLDIMNSFFL